MQNILEVYVDTSVWNYIHATHMAESQRATLEFFDIVKRGNVEIAISKFVIDEVAAAPTAVKEKLTLSIKEFKPNVLDFTEEVEGLADGYIDEGAFSPAKKNDALHVAFATIYDMDALVTWNCKDLANIRKRRIIEAVNIKLGYIKKLDIITPMEVQYEA